MNDHFVILTSAREIIVSKSSFLWNFEIIRIESLTRQHSLELTHKLSYDIEVEDFELFRNQIWVQSTGDPRVIALRCERYRNEIIVSTGIIRSVRHTGALPEIEMSFAVLLGLGSLATPRYLSGEAGKIL